MLNVQYRIVNTRRHTIGYKLGNKLRSRAEAVSLARQGKVNDVTVRRGGNDEMHIVSLPGSQNLTDLPERVDYDRSLLATR
jgi:hypothetical protein